MPFVARIERLLWAHAGSRDIWMIVDGARDRAIYSLLLDSSLQRSCLYSGSIPFELEVAAPHLVQLERGDSFTRRLIARAWGNSWGVFLQCDAASARLRRHLRQFLVVSDWTGRRLLFRYYDPRVLRAYLPTCDGQDLRTVFGPIERFWTEGETPDDLLGFQLAGNRLEFDLNWLPAVETP